MALVRYWAGARRAAGRDSETVQAATLGELRLSLLGRPELAGVVHASSLLVDGVASAADSTALAVNAVVDVLPPFAGG
jgi:molybdopterin synthase sulfur carrier subunit